MHSEYINVFRTFQLLNFLVSGKALKEHNCNETLRIERRLVRAERELSEIIQLIFIVIFYPQRLINMHIYENESYEVVDD